jgi:hypothetical protein
MAGTKPDWQIIQEVANRLGANWKYQHPSEIMDEIALLTPLVAGVTTVVETANTPENIRAIRNLLLLSKLLGDIDPDVLGSLVSVFPDALQHASSDKTRPPVCCLLYRSSIAGTPAAEWRLRPACSRA